MLRGLDIRDMLIIDRLELAFQPGLNVLTGETGAGKSILLDSLGFVLGWRGRAELVRAGAEQGEVTAWFDLPEGHAARDVLAEAGLEPDDELILRRINTKDGRKTAWVNDRRVSGEVLRALSEVLVELHGQHDDRGLLNPRGHMQLLDAFAQVSTEKTRAAWRALAAAKKDLAETEARIAAAREEEDYLRHAVAELDALSPEFGEESALDSQRRLMQAAEKIRADIAKADEALGLQGAEGSLTDASRWLGGAVDKADGRLDAPLAALERVMLELDALSPEFGEESALDSQRRLMQAAEKIRADIAKADEALGLQGAEGSLTDASRWLGGAVDKADGRLDAPLAALERVMQELDAAQRGVADCLSSLSFNPADLEDCEERLFAIRGLARKHNVQPDELIKLAEELRNRLQVLDDGDAELANQQAALVQAQAAFDNAAAALTVKRTKSAKQLDKAMAAELAPLKMERAVFVTAVTPDDPGPDGVDAVAFTVATNPGAPAGPLNKIASGGELSRFLLALKVCLTQAGGGGLTMIFDEIDRGVGGATAAAVGRRLASLADGGQVLVVTHSPQVAALGGHHWRVEKKQDKATTLSTVTPLDMDARVDEIARMLSGDTITDAARAAAEALMHE